MKTSLAIGILSVFSFQSLNLIAKPLYASDYTEGSGSVLISQKKGYREHQDLDQGNRFSNRKHSKDHNWKDHYHSISSIKLKANGNLKIRFCENVELLEGFVDIDGRTYNVLDADKVKKRKITWVLNEKKSFSKGETVDINTNSFIGRPVEDEPNSAKLRSFKRGCGLAYANIPDGVKVKGTGSAAAALGAALLIGIGIAAGGSGSGSSSSN